VPTQFGNVFPITLVVSDSSNPVQQNSITYYVDALPAVNPPLEVVADASQLGPAMTRDQLGVNLEGFFSSSGDPAYIPLWSSAGIHAIRHPGGADADFYHWQTNTWGCGFGTPVASFAFDNWMQTIVAPLSSDVFVTVNYGRQVHGRVSKNIRAFAIINSGHDPSAD